MGCFISKDDGGASRKSKRTRRKRPHVEQMSNSDRGEVPAPPIGEPRAELAAASNPLGGRRHSHIQKPSGGNPFLLPLSPTAGLSANPAACDMPTPKRSKEELKESPVLEDAAAKHLTAESLRHLCDEDIEEAFQSMRDLSDSDLEEELRMSSTAGTPVEESTESFVDCLSIAELIARVKAGLLAIPNRIPCESLHTKVKYRDLQGWMAELGTVPAPVASVSGNPVGIRLCEKALDQNHRLLLQVKRTKPSSATFMDEDVTFGEERRGSRTSQNRITGDEDPGFAIESFYRELDDEERRLSQMEAEISDDDEK
jgi:hypothetical protein